MALKNIDIWNKKYEPKKTAEKFTVSTVIVFVLSVLLNYIQSSQEPILDLSLRSVAVGLIFAIINYMKHREVK